MSKDAYRYTGNELLKSGLLTVIALQIDRKHSHAAFAVTSWGRRRSSERKSYFSKYPGACECAVPSTLRGGQTPTPSATLHPTFAN